MNVIADIEARTVNYYAVGPKPMVIRVTRNDAGDVMAEEKTDDGWKADLDLLLKLIRPEQEWADYDIERISSKKVKEYHLPGRHDQKRHAPHKFRKGKGTWQNVSRVNGKVSLEFQGRAEKAWNEIPQEIRMQLENEGFHVVMNEKLSDSHPELAQEKPRGWPPGSTFESVEAFYDPPKKQAVLNENVRSGFKETLQPDGSYKSVTLYKKATGDVADSIVHETGHGIDHLFKPADDTHGPSKSGAFYHAWTGDVEKMSNQNKSRFAYYIQGGQFNGGGPSEAFAEGFKIAMFRKVGRSSEKGTRSVAEWEIHFPSVLKEVEATVADIGGRVAVI